MLRQVSLRSIRFDNVDDVWDLIGTFSRYVEPSQVTLELVAQQLVVASDGETYLVSQIESLSDEEADAAAVTFVTKNGEKHSLAALRKSIRDKVQLDQYIHNRPLAEMLQSASPNREEFLNLNVPTAQPLKPFPLVFPVITPLEISYERYAIDAWLVHEPLEKKAKKGLTADAVKTYPPPYGDKVLSRADLFSNQALQDLIWLNLLQHQEQIIYCIEMLKRTKQKEERRRLQEKIAQSVVVIQDYQDGLLVQQTFLKTKTNDMGKIKSDYEEIIKKYPDLIDKNISELETLSRKARRREKRLSLLASFGFMIGCAVLALGLSAVFMATIGIAIVAYVAAIGGLFASVGGMIGAIMPKIDRYLGRKRANIDKLREIKPVWENPLNRQQYESNKICLTLANGYLEQISSFQNMKKLKSETQVKSELSRRSTKTLSNTNIHANGKSLLLFKFASPDEGLMKGTLQTPTSSSQRKPGR